MQGISAVVATLNRKEELNRLFKTFVQNKIDSLEVILVDQNKDDRLEDIVNEYKSFFKILHLKQDVANQSKARNLGAQHATKEIICFPDDDCWFEESALIKVQQHFDSIPQTDLLLINWQQNPYRHELSKWITAADVFSFRSVGYVTYVQFFKTSVFKKLRGFNESIGIGQYIGGGEDSDLMSRAVQEGYTTFYNAEIKVNHNYIPITTRDYPVIRARQRAIGMTYAKFKVPYFIIFRGLLSPLPKILFSLNRRKSKQQLNILKGRWEGFIHTLKNKNKIQ